MKMKNTFQIQHLYIHQIHTLILVHTVERGDGNYYSTSLFSITYAFI